METIKDSGLEIFYQSANLIDCLFRHAEKTPDKLSVRIIYENRRVELTYSDILRKSFQVAKIIAAYSNYGDRIVIAMPTSEEFIFAFFGCLISGRIAVPLPVEKPTARYSRLLGVVNDCAPTLALYKSQQDSDLMGLQNLPLKPLLIDGAEDNLAQLNRMEMVPNKVSFLQYTSGSTSSPKGVVVTQNNIFSNLKMIQQSMAITSEDHIFSWLPLHHDMGLIGMLLIPIVCGAKTTITPFVRFSKNPWIWLEEMSNSKCTIAGAPNFAFDFINKKYARRISEDGDALDLSGIRLLFCGSEKIVKKTIIEFYKNLAEAGLRTETFFPCYGLAEACLLVSGKLLGSEFFSSQDSSAEQTMSCGYPGNGIQITILDEDGLPTPPNNVGEITLEGASVTPGYWNEVGPNVLPFNENQLIHKIKTGDLGYIRNNELYITGRKKDLIKIRGRNIHPEDVEPAVESLSDWMYPNGCVAVSHTISEKEELLIIVECLRTKRNAKFQTLVSRVQFKLSDLGIICDRLIVVSPSGLPKTSSGKKQRSKTLDMFIAGKLDIIWDSKSVIAESNGQTPSDASFKLPLDMDSDLLALEKYINLHADIFLSDERRTFPADFLLKMHQLKMFGFLISNNLGGRGLSHSQFAEVAKRLGRIDFTVAALLGNHNTIGIIPILKSSFKQKFDKVLEDIARSGKISAFALTEPNAGSNPRAMTTNVTQRDASTLVLNGEKIWIGNSTYADYICVFAREFDSNHKETGISAFLLNRNLHNYSVLGEQKTLGLKAMPQARLAFDNVILKESDRLSEPGKGLKLAFESMEYARFALAATAVGVIEKAASHLHQFAMSRNIWTGKLSENTYYRQELGKVLLKSETIQCVVDWCAKELADIGHLSPVSSLSCKILGGEWVFECCDTILQFMGGRGFTETFPVARFWRDSRIVRIFEGPTEALSFQLGAIVTRDKGVFKLSPEIDDSPAQKFWAMLDSSEFKEILKGQLKDTALVYAGEVGAHLFAYTTLGIEKNAARHAIREKIESLVGSFFKRMIEAENSMKILSKRSDELVKMSSSVSVSKSFDNWPLDSVIKPLASPPPFIVTPELRKEIAVQSRPTVSVRTKVSEDLTSWLKVHMRLTEVNPKKSLAEYGVDSLLAYELMCFIEDTFLIPVEESWILDKPSIDILSEQISVRMEEKKVPIKGKSAT